MHFMRRWCQCRKLSWKPFSGIPHSNVVTLRWMSGVSANPCPLWAFFIILERAKNRTGLSQENKVDGPFLYVYNMDSWIGWLLLACFPFLRKASFWDHKAVYVNLRVRRFKCWSIWLIVAGVGMIVVPLYVIPRKSYFSVSNNRK
jgi:hypothetical protein